jgi:hypothetical protein
MSGMCIQWHFTGMKSSFPVTINRPLFFGRFEERRLQRLQFKLLRVVAVCEYAAEVVRSAVKARHTGANTVVDVPDHVYAFEHSLAPVCQPSASPALDWKSLWNSSTHPRQMIAAGPSIHPLTSNGRLPQNEHFCPPVWES